MIASTRPNAKMANNSTQPFKIKEVKMLIDELELESALDRDSLDFEINNMVVNLPLDGSEFTLTSQVVPEGAYDEFEMELEHPDDNHSVSDPDFYNKNSHDDDDNFSVVVKGTYNGQAFTFQSKMNLSWRWSSKSRSRSQPTTAHR